jgi:hypothetical protein
MDIIKLYTNILNATGCKVDKEGYVSVDPSVFTGEPSEKTLPFIVNEKRVVLPTFEHQRSASDDKIIFHPLNENILRGESDVVIKLRTAFSIRLNHLFFISIKTAIQMIYDIDSHRKFSPQQHEILSLAPDLDETTAVDFVRMMKAATAQGSNSHVSLYLKRSGTVDGKKFSRVGVVGFPFYNELKKEQDTYYGVKLRKRDRVGLLKLIEFIFPDIDKEGSYSRGSNSQVAPFMDALMKAVMSVGSKLNDYFETYKNVIPDFDQGMLISSDWVEDMDNLEANIIHIRKIPSQPGNEGSIKQEPNLPVSAAPVQPAPVVYSTPVQQPVQQPQVQPWQHSPIQQPQPIHQTGSATPSSNGKVSFSSISPVLGSTQLPPSLMAGDPRMMQMYHQQQQFNHLQQYQRSTGARSTLGAPVQQFNNGFAQPQFNGGFPNQGFPQQQPWSGPQGFSNI